MCLIVQQQLASELRSTAFQVEAQAKQCERVADVGRLQAWLDKQEKKRAQDSRERECTEEQLNKKLESVQDLLHDGRTRRSRKKEQEQNRRQAVRDRQSSCANNRATLLHLREESAKLRAKTNFNLTHEPELQLADAIVSGYSLSSHWLLRALALLVLVILGLSWAATRN